MFFHDLMPFELTQYTVIATMIAKRMRYIYIYTQLLLYACVCVCAYVNFNARGPTDLLLKSMQIDA